MMMNMMKNTFKQKNHIMKKLALLSLISLVTAYAWTQGCVAIRNVAGISPDLLFKNVSPNDKWLMSVTNRYFQASDSYRGDKFVTDTLVENKIYTLNISAQRI